MSDAQILEAARRILSNVKPQSQAEARIIRDGIDATLWVECDLTFGR